jgi:hypothetical protein
MSIIQTQGDTAANRAHAAACAASEATRQVSVSAAGNNQASVRAADIAYYRACLASAITNKCSTDAFITALKELGTGGS